MSKKVAKVRASKPARKQPTTIIEFDAAKVGFVYPFEKDRRGYLFDGKRVSHAQALRVIAAKHGRQNSGYSTLDCEAFSAFLRECANLIEGGAA